MDRVVMTSPFMPQTDPQLHQGTVWCATRTSHDTQTQYRDESLVALDDTRKITSRLTDAGLQTLSSHRCGRRPGMPIG